MVNTLLICDILLLFWLSLEDLKSMKVKAYWLNLFLLLSLAVVIYNQTYDNVIIAIVLYFGLKVMPGYKVGVGDQQIFAGLAMQFGLVPVAIILVSSFMVVKVIARNHPIPFIPVIFAIFLGVMHYTVLLGKL